jgi:hypothetical protein
MHIERFNNNGLDYLRLVEGKRMVAPNGKSRTGKRVLLSIGALAKFDDGRPDYLGRLRQSFRDGKPLIPSLQPFVGAPPPRKVTVVFRAGDKKCLGRPRRMAAAVLDPVFNALGLGALLASVKHASKIRYDLAGIVRLLVYGRLLEPASKCATMSQNGKWLVPVVSSGNGDNVYDALTVVERNRRQILRRMNTCITRGTGRRAGTVFYDVTNFFFETEDADPDEEVEAEADDGTKKVETARGLRQRGVSKENRREPIVQTGLFLDDQGIPLSIEEFPGNTLDAQTLKDAMRRTIDNFDMGRFILVADRGMYSGTNVLKVIDGGNGYIVAKSLLKSTAADRRWATGPKDWECAGEDLRIKSRTVTRKAVDGNGNPVLDENGEQREYEEKVVVYWSRAFYERQRHENESFLEFVEELRRDPNGFRVTKANYRSLRKFLKKKVVNTETGEELDGTKLRAMIDDEKLDAFKDLMGYYQIVSSETGMPSSEIIEKYHGLTQIEDQFREMKGTLRTRPVYVRTREHIKAHLLVCFIALTMMRLIQRKTKAALPEVGGKDVKWSYGIPGARIARALRDWKACELPGGEYYQMLDADGGDIGAVLRAFGVNVTPQVYTKGELIALKSSVSPF